MTPAAPTTTLIPDAWFYTYLIQPVLEGLERLKRVFAESEVTLLGHRTIPCKERPIYLLVGLPLSIPLISTIIWLFMQAFGNPTPYTPPYHVWRTQTT